MSKFNEGMIRQEILCYEDEIDSLIELREKLDKRINILKDRLDKAIIKLEHIS